VAIFHGAATASSSSQWRPRDGVPRNHDVRPVGLQYLTSSGRELRRHGRCVCR
jgi:hypothetical protein